MSYGKYTITLRRSGVVYKLCKIWFGGDGSYYVTSPYREHNNAFLKK